MATKKRASKSSPRARRLKEAIEVLSALGFGGRQSNEVAAYRFLALLDLAANAPWSAASNPLRGITPIIEFVAKAYGVRYAPNTRETIRDEAVKYFVEAGLLLRNPDNPSRPTNSGQTVYQVEPTALALARTFGTTKIAVTSVATRSPATTTARPRSSSRSDDSVTGANRRRLADTGAGKSAIRREG